MSENEISYLIIGKAIEIDKELGPGLLESVYENTLAFELNNLGLFVEQQVAMPLIYKSIKLACGYRMDLRVEKKVIVEFKSVETIAPVHFVQTLTYTRLSGCKLGLLINFKTILLKDGIQRVVNNL